MKNILQMKYTTNIILALLAVVCLWSCSEDEVGPVAHLNGAPQITAPTSGASFVLTQASQDSLVPAFSWTAADWGFDAETTYALEMDVAGNNFASAVTLIKSSALELADFTQADLNNLMIGKELPVDVPSAMELRVIATVGPDRNPNSSVLGTDVPAQVSNTVTISVTPFEANVVIPELQVPGSYQGWAPTDTTTVIFSAKNDNKYEGYVYISPDNSEYKFTQGFSWDVNWGDNGSDGTLEPGGANIVAPVAGVYRLNVDLGALTHTQLLTTWGLIGSATPNGWDSDQDMTYDPGTKKWTITLDLAAGEVKFRANDDWAVNLGDDAANGILEYNGANIAITEAGNYTINLLIVGIARYRYEVIKN